MVVLRFIFLIVLTSFARAVDYQLDQPPQHREIYDHREYNFRLRADEAIDIGPLPEHPKIFWLSTITSREDGRTNSDGYIVNLSFMATSPGLIQFPPLPVKIGDESLLLRLNDLTARTNPVKAHICSLELLWDGQPEMPKHAYIGQAFELTLKEIVLLDRHNTFPNDPKRFIEGVDWFVFTPIPGRRATSQDYLRPIGEPLSSFGTRFGFRRSGPRRFLRYQRTEETRGNFTYQCYLYRARFTVGAADRIKGHCYFNAGFGSARRVALAKVDIPVRSVPPLPHETAVDSGLVGDWTIEGALAPSELEAKQPFKIALGIVGIGDPTLLKDPDFSRPGFSSVSQRSVYLNQEKRKTIHRQLSFEQELLPSGETPVFPPVTLATFDPKQDEWKLHKITPAITLKGLSESVAATTRFLPAADLGRQLQRPILLNLPTFTFPLVALAPFLPFLAGFIKRRLDQRDPELKARREQFAKLVSRLKESEASPAMIDDEVVPFLRTHLSLPTGTTTREVAENIKVEHSELASLLTQHSDSAFSSKAVKIDLKSLANHLAKIALLFLIIFSPLHGATLEEANTAFGEERYRTAAGIYQELIAKTPGHPNLHLNLAKARLSVDQPSHARAACHTALLLDPTSSEGRQLMDQILQRMGQPTLPGTQLLELRPDQFLFLATWLWVGGFLIFAARKLFAMPAWPAWLCLTLALAATSIAFVRKDQAYAADQFMVLAEELPREPEAGTPSWDFPALRSGQIVRVSAKTATHGQVVTPDTSFWLPLDQLQQVW